MGRWSRRTFTPAFKAQVVLELLSEQRSSAELSAGSSSVVHSPDLEGHGLSGLPSLWRRGEQRGPERSHIAELEQLVGRQTLELEIVNRSLQAASWDRGHLKMLPSQVGRITGFAQSKPIFTSWAPLEPRLRP